MPASGGADSLVMADRAVAMAEAGCKAVCVLGVDFMSENVRAILDNAGHTGVAVYRMAADAIGCTLAEAAESAAYLRWLDGAADTGRGVHVIYINTSLRTKAEANARVPTITCTSSNVVKTVLQAFAQVRAVTSTDRSPSAVVLRSYHVQVFVPTFFFATPIAGALLLRECATACWLQLAEACGPG